MRVTDNDKKFGFFWIPSNDNGEPEEKDKIPGTLSIKDGGRIQLELFSSSCVTLKRKTPRIVGTVERFGFVTLDDCLYYRSNFSYGIKKWFLSIEIAFIGVQYKTNEEPKFNTFSFSVEGLHYWMRKSGIKHTNDNHNNTFSIRYELPDNTIYKIDEDIKVLFCHKGNEHFKYDIHHSSVQIVENINCKIIASKELPLSTLISVAGKINSFLYFIMDQVVCIKNVKATSENIQKEYSSINIKKPVDIKLFYKNYPFIKKSPQIVWPLFGFNFMQKNANQALNKWVNLYDKTNPALELYLSTQIGEHTSLKDNFLTLVKFIEAYHQKMFYSKKMDLKKRLKRFIEPLKELTDFHDEQRLINDIVNTRNYFTHYNPEKESKALHDDLYYLYLKLEGIVQLTLLKELGFSDPKVKYIVDDNHKLKQKVGLFSKTS